MKEITLNNKDYLLVEVPDDAENIRYNHTPDWKLKYLVFTCEKDTRYSADFIDAKLVVKIIGKLSDILKDEKVCHYLADSELKSTGFLYLDWGQPDNEKRPYKFDDASNSIISYLQSIELDMTKEYALIEKP